MSKVLIIDDSATIRRSAEIFLRDTPHQLISAEDGYDAMRVIADSKPDIVFIDVTMPRLDGYDTCSIIRKFMPELPIVMLSGKGSMFDRARGKLAGANEYITKPFPKDAFIGAISKFIKQE